MIEKAFFNYSWEIVMCDTYCYQCVIMIRIRITYIPLYTLLNVSDACVYTLLNPSRPCDLTPQAITLSP